MAYKPKRMPKQTIDKRRLKLHPFANTNAGINNYKSVRLYSCCEKVGNIFHTFKLQIGELKKIRFY